MNKIQLTGFTALFFALAAFHCILGINSDSVLFASSTKILPLLLLTAGVCAYGFRPLVVTALVMSMFGDVAAEFNALGPYRMPLQITFFAAAQVFYAIEFLKFRRPHGNSLMGVLPFMMGIYGALELFTLICASIQERRNKWCFVLGAGLFLFSDALILVRFLTGGFPCASLMVMTTYYLAQYFLNVALLGDLPSFTKHRES